MRLQLIVTVPDEELEDAVLQQLVFAADRQDVISVHVDQGIGFDLTLRDVERVG